jgi:hypothetical protein
LQFWFNQDTRLSLPTAMIWNREQQRVEYLDFTGTDPYPAATGAPPEPSTADDPSN